MKRSHSRDTHPFDKQYPREDTKDLRRGGWKSKVVQLIKRMQKKKQRQHDKDLCEVVNPIIVFCKHCKQEIDINDDDTHVCTDLRTNYNLEE